MTREWQPGDPIPEGGYTITFTWNEAAIERMLRVLRDGYPSGHRSMATAVATALSGGPLVVIDPEDREQVERLVGTFRGLSGWASSLGRESSNAMQAALRSLITPPKPDEPLGLGAVVEDANGRLWIRVSEALVNCWLGPAGEHHHWDRVPAVRVLSEGVTA